MLVSPTQNSGVGGIAQRQPPTPGILRRKRRRGLTREHTIVNFSVGIIYLKKRVKFWLKYPPPPPRRARFHIPRCLCIVAIVDGSSCSCRAERRPRAPTKYIFGRRHAPVGRPPACRRRHRPRRRADQGSDRGSDDRGRARIQ